MRSSDVENLATDLVRNVNLRTRAAIEVAAAGGLSFYFVAVNDDVADVSRRYHAYLVSKSPIPIISFEVSPSRAQVLLNYPEPAGDPHQGRLGDVRKRVLAAIDQQRRRQGTINGLLEVNQLRQFANLNHLAWARLMSVQKNLGLTKRDTVNLVRMARTAVDMDGREQVEAYDIGYAGVFAANHIREKMSPPVKQVYTARPISLSQNGTPCEGG